jgi:hypothetical protein
MLHYALVIFGCICGAISFCVSLVDLIEAFSEDGTEADVSPVQQSENESATQVALNATKDGLTRLLNALGGDYK